LMYQNNKPIESFEKLREELNITISTWKKNVMPEINKFNIVKKEKINGANYLVLNPLYSVKSRGINEYVFKCFHSELMEYIHPMQYILLSKVYSVNIDNTIYKWKNTQNDTRTIDLSEDMAKM